ncbi:putative plant-like oligopeptide transporter [Mycena kentingensis (nom. inval.)]|nr:putative plant-like oligopeptide transporter [Mycena kentingensis (nom. inval.)]
MDSTLPHTYTAPPELPTLGIDEKRRRNSDGDASKEDGAPSSIKEVDADAETTHTYDWDSPEFRDIPELVRSIVSFEDNPSLPVMTFRSVTLSIFFVIAGSVVSQIGFFRTTTAEFSVFFVILTADPLGRFLARVLPEWTIPLGRLSFSLNPGPWSTKEHAIVGIAANAGSKGEWAIYLPTNAKLYYGIDMSPAVALFFAWATASIGFSFAAMCRQLLIYDPVYVFPLSLQQVTLYRSMEQKGDGGTERSRQQMRVFWLVLLTTFLWQFLPEYVFPLTASLAPLCWLGGKSHVANFLGAGHGGVGLLNITLDWSNITSTIITYPYSVQVIVFVAFVFTTWLLIPIAYFANLWGSPTYEIMSNGLFTQNGTAYPFATILSVVNGEQVFNQTMYDQVGLAYAGAAYMWGIFFWYASYLSAFVWFGLFVGPKLARIWRARRDDASRRASRDRLTKIIEANYNEVTLAEWAAVFIAPFLILLLIVLKGGIYMPLFTYFVGLLFGAAATLPMATIYGLSGFQLKVGLFNELVYGYMIDGVKSSSRHSLGQLAYRIISGNAWYDCYHILEDQKIGHYLHLPPRTIIGTQLIAVLASIPVNYGMMR